MTNENIAAIQEQMVHDMIDAPIELEKEIDDLSRHIAGQLTWGARQKVTVEFQDDVYAFSYLQLTENDKAILRIIVIRGRNELVENNGRKFTVDIEWDSDLTTFENIRYGVKALFQHITGTIEPEILEE